MSAAIEEIVAHLGAALMQADPSDDQIIIGHVRDAHKLALELFRAHAQPPTKPADEIIGQIEERFPDWRGFRDLVDCIDVTLHRLRGGS